MASIIDRNTKNLMTAKLQKELSDLFAEQESSKRPRYNLMSLKAGGGAKVPGDPQDEWVGGINTDPMSEWNSTLDETNWAPASDPNTPWNLMASGVGPGQYLNDKTQTPSNAFNFKDKMQVYGQQALGKLGDAIPGMAAISPVISNLIGGLGKSQRLNARDYYNPNRDKIMSLMSNRRMNINPQLDAVLNSERTGQYNLKNSANSRGELMGNLMGLQNNAMRNRASIYANKQNADLGYQGQEAEMLNNLGAGQQQANWNVMDYNNQNIANKRNMWRAGLSQLSQYSQSKELMKNQQTQDQNKYAALQDMFTAIAPFMKSLQSMQFSNI